MTTQDDIAVKPPQPQPSPQGAPPRTGPGEAVKRAKHVATVAFHDNFHWSVPRRTPAGFDFADPET
jgi:hypothetical protein